MEGDGSVLHLLCGHMPSAASDVVHPALRRTMPCWKDRVRRRVGNGTTELLRSGASWIVPGTVDATSEVELALPSFQTSLHVLLMTL